jgi:hypothetical protein
MPVNRVLKNAKLDPDEVERLNRAFEMALRLLCLVDRGDPLCEIVARKVIMIAESTVHYDPKRIAEMAVRQLGVP